MNIEVKCLKMLLMKLERKRRRDTDATPCNLVLNKLCAVLTRSDQVFAASCRMQMDRTHFVESSWAPVTPVVGK